MLLALAGTKGGTGKTTLSLGVAVAAAIRGRRVLVVDSDPRGDCLSWRIAAPSDAPRVLGLAGPLLPSAETLRGLSYGHDLTVVDTPANDPESLEIVLRAADHVLLPVGPCPMQVWAIGDTLDVLVRARDANPQLQVSLLINRVDPRTILGKSLPTDLAQLGLPILRTRVHARAIHPEAMAHGSVACDYEPLSPAARELFDLSEELETRTHHTSFATRLAH
jgi:chromosome partitioning protein